MGGAGTLRCRNARSIQIIALTSESTMEQPRKFNRDPAEQGGLRYCINSASLRFIHRDDMLSEGYGAYLHQVK